VNRKYRLRKTETIKRVRRLGKSFAHPLIVLSKHPNSDNITRFGIIARKSIGLAVKRNQKKRQLREILREAYPSTKPGWDIIILLRRPSRDATYLELKAAVKSLLVRADLSKVFDAKGNRS